MIPCSIGGIEYTETSLWTNSAPTSAFAAQDVTLSDSIENYKYIAIKYKYATDAGYNEGSYISTSIISVTDLKKCSYNTSLTRPGMALGVTTSGNVNWTRFVAYKSNTNLYFWGAGAVGAANTNTTNVIPLEILGLNELDISKTSKVQLWLNPSPTTNFAAQTISLDLSDYEAVIIRVSVATNYNTDAQKPYQLFNYIPKDGAVHYLHSLLNTSGTSSAYYGRQVTVTDSGITFSLAGYPVSTLATSSQSTMIPTEIYGLKYTEPIYPDDPRKFILKNGVFQGTQGTDYGVLGTLTQNTGFVTIASGTYTTGITPFISATDKTKYKRLVFDSECITSRLYYSTTESGSRTLISNTTYALNLNTLSDNVFVYLMPSGATMNYYNIYLE